MQEFESPNPSTPPPLQNRNQEETAPVMRLGDWLVTMLIMIVPILNAIMLFIWSTDRNTNPNKSNWAKATLIIIGIQIVLMMFFIGMIIGSLSDLMSGFNQSCLW